MASSEPFTFGIPLIARASAGNWRLVETLLDLTLTSLRAQTDQDFRVVLAGHDRPRTFPDDPRMTFVRADWPASAPRSDNLDSGRKKHAINRLVLERGGGLLMFLDADDWVDVHLVEAARATIRPDHVGGVVKTGFVADFWSLRAVPLPHPHVFAGGFHRLCGSSIVARLRPGMREPLRRDPFAVLHEHYRWPELARMHGAEAVCLPVWGGYVINTSENHSETHGPFAAWRREFTESVNREGNVLDEALARRFGLGLDRIHAASDRFIPTIAAARGRDEA